MLLKLFKSWWQNSVVGDIFEKFVPDIDLEFWAVLEQSISYKSEAVNILCHLHLSSELVTNIDVIK